MDVALTLETFRSVQMESTKVSPDARLASASKPRRSLWLPRSRIAWSTHSSTVHPNTSPPRIASASTWKPPASVDSLIRANLRRQLALRQRVFQSDLPFSWLRFTVGIISLALVFSDIPRSGLGVRDLASLYTMVEPDAMSFYDPWNYTIARLAKDENHALSMHNQSVRVWSYKFDSTSIAWRAMAQHLGLAGAAFPTCLFYIEPCAAEKLRGSVAFGMIDAMVSAVAANPDQAVQLRSISVYVDRVHDFVLPPTFALRHWRTNQALYFSAEELEAIGARICHSRNHKLPNLCQERWVNYRYACSRHNALCRRVGRVLDHTLARVRAVSRKFPNASVDLTLIESQEDAAHVRGGISMVGVRRSDVSTIIRARRCANATVGCETVYVEDYRYQSGLGEADAPHWYALIATLRIVGQAYFILRVFGLVLSCYYAHVSPDLGPAPRGSSTNTLTTTSSANTLTSRTTAVPQKPQGIVLGRLKLAWRVFSKVPTQCVVFGSPLPVICYAIAHAIDAPLTYVVLEKRFTSQNGVLNLGLRTFVSVAVVQMRNVWVFTMLLHCVVALSTSRRWQSWCHFTGGVLGVPEFLLSGFSSVTIAAQFRSTTFRSTRVLAVFPIATTARHNLPTVKYQQFGAHRGSGNLMLGGVFIDLKCLIFLVIFMSVVLAIATQLLKWVHEIKRTYRCHRGVVADQYHRGAHEDSNYRWLLLGKTPVPYSAGTLWPTVAMCVHWTSDFFCIHPPRVGPSSTECRTLHSVVLPALAQPHEHGSPGIRRLTSGSVSLVASVVAASLNVSVRMNYRTFSAIQLQMERVHDRRAVVEANVAFMNLVIMSDPLVYARRFLSFRDRSKMLGYYRSLRSCQANVLLLLPREAVDEDNEHMQHLELLCLVPIAALSWSELVQCG